MQLTVYTDPPELMAGIGEWSSATSNTISHVGDPTQWSASDVETVRDSVSRWLMAQPIRATTVTTVPVTEKSLPRRYRDGSLYEPTLKVGVWLGSSKAWVEIVGLRPAVIDELLRRRSEEQAQRE